MQGDISILIAFTAGTLSFFSPCVLPLIPSYITFLIGDYSKQ
ncbi:MAG TPA: cytochrome c biogenesis protein CcdA, partial [Halanaerobiales bacterium]|nr:cytochrome c biogenesis protein CcdA [Halanaerobiales bacterium]